MKSIPISPVSAANEKNIRVLVVDDHESVRDGIRFVVNSMEGWEICGEASEGRVAADLAEKLKPAIVVMDMNLPGLNGVDATRLIRKRCPETEVLAFTAVEEEKVIHQIFEAGAKSYVFKTDSRETIRAALVALSQHKSYLTNKVGEVLFAKFLHGKENVSTGPEPGRLTPREREIVQQLADGKSNKEVAAALGISVKTAEAHRTAIQKKLKLEGLAALVRYAIRNNIIAA